jgi:hypothetical protein
MWWLVGIGAYILFLALAWVFIRGATVRECPKPQQAIYSLPPILQTQSETTASTVAFALQRRSVWEKEVSYLQAP